MPIEARKKTERAISGTTVENNPTIAEIISDLSNGNQKLLLVYVEDEFSKKLLIEIIRKSAPTLLKALSIAPVGSKEAVLHAVRYTRKHKDIKCIGIRDEQSSACAKENVFAYPSDKAPEEEIFRSKPVSEFLLSQYQSNFLETLDAADDHHEYANQISRQCDVDKATIEVQCIQAYVSNQDISKFAPLLDNIKKQC